MPRVRTIAAFTDREGKVERRVGDVFDVTDARLAELNACGDEQNHVQLVEVVVARAPRVKTGEGKAE